jgi:hypothetical protein
VRRPWPAEETAPAARGGGGQGEGRFGGWDRRVTELARRTALFIGARPGRCCAPHDARSTCRILFCWGLLRLSPSRGDVFSKREKRGEIFPFLLSFCPVDAGRILGGRVGGCSVSPSSCVKRCWRSELVFYFLPKLEVFTNLRANT